MLEFAKKYAILKNNTARQAYVLFLDKLNRDGLYAKNYEIEI